MKVKYSKNSTTNFKTLIEEKIYDVITVNFSPRQINNEENFYTLSYRIIDEQGTPGIFDGKFFEVTDNTIPKDFIYKLNDKGLINLMPESISYDSFWEDFFNDDINAIELFKERFPDYQEW